MDRDASHLRGKGHPCYCTEPVPERSPATVGLADFTLLTSLRAHLNKEKISPEQCFWKLSWWFSG